MVVPGRTGYGGLAGFCWYPSCSSSGYQEIGVGVRPRGLAAGPRAWPRLRGRGRELGGCRPRGCRGSLRYRGGLRVSRLLV
jgi:hypothetical protein